MGANVDRPLPMTGADDSDQPHNYKGLMNEKGPSGAEFYSCTDQVHSLPESGQEEYTIQNIERDMLIDLKNVFTDDVELKPKDARRVSLELIFPILNS